MQLQGNLFVCSRTNGNCCCGWEEKGRMPFDNSVWADEWERRKIRSRVHLSFTGCLGPCAVGNNAMLQLLGESIWFKDLNDAALIPRVFDYVEAILVAGRVVAPPDELVEHIYARYGVVPLSAGDESRDEVATVAQDGLDGIDPVCLMEVEPTTARYTVEYRGRVIGFCAPACKKQFLADPEAYLVA